MHIPVVIPFMEGKKIGQAYNREIKRLDDNGWIILLDYDVMIMNPYWHEICVKAIERYGRICGLFTCYTNRIGCKVQIAPQIDQENHDILYHRDYAKKLWLTHGGNIMDCTPIRGCRFSGFFMLTSKAIWQKVNGFKTDSFFHVDVDYYDKVKKAGYKTMLMQDLYCYHLYKRETLSPFFTRNENVVSEENPRTPREV